MQFDSRIQIGDIALIRNFNAVGLFVRYFFPATLITWPSGRSPHQMSNHEGIFGIRDNVEGIFESSGYDAPRGHRLFFTPWSECEQKIKEKKLEYHVVRLPSLTSADRREINTYLERATTHKIPYDYTGALSIATDALLHHPTLHRENRKAWYCTEVLRSAFHRVGKSFLRTSLPTPYDVEVAVKSGILYPIADFY